MYQNDKTKVLTGEVRFSYVQLHEAKPPKSDPTGKPRFSTTLLIPKTDTATVNDIRASIKAAGDEALNSRWGGRAPLNLDGILHDGDGVKDSGEPYGDECKGHWVLAVKSYSKPSVVGIDNIRAELDPRDVYSGMYGRATISFFGYANNKKGITAMLGNVLKTRDGEPLTSRSSAASDFAGLAIDPVTGAPM